MEQEERWEHPPTLHGHQWGVGDTPGTLSLPGCWLHPAPSPSPAPHLPGMSSARPGLGSAVPPAPRRPPSASGSAERPPPVVSAPYRNGLSTHRRAQDMCQDPILPCDSPGRHGATASPCVPVLARPCPKPPKFEPPMSQPLYPSPHQPPTLHHSVSQPHVPVPLFQLSCPSPPYFRALCASAICSFWKISGGRNGESFPPSSEQTRRCLGRGGGPPPRSCAAGFTWAFPGEGAGQVGCASPPAWPWGGIQLPKTGPPPLTHPAPLRWI